MGQMKQKEMLFTLEALMAAEKEIERLEKLIEAHGLIISALEDLVEIKDARIVSLQKMLDIYENTSDN